MAITLGTAPTGIRDATIASTILPPPTPAWTAAALLILAFGSLLSPPLVNLGITMGLVALSTAQAQTLRTWAATPTVIIALVLGAWVVLRALATWSGASPYDAAIRSEDVWAYLRIAGPLPAILGLLFALNTRYRYCVLALFLLSWFVYIGRGFSVTEFMRALDGTRLQFGHSPTELAMVGGGAFMAGLSFLFSGSFRARRQPWWAAGFLLLGLAAIVSGGTGVLLSLTRSAWLSFAVTLPIVLMGWTVTCTRAGHLPRSFPVALLACSLTLAGVLGWAAKDTISARFAEGGDTVEAIVAGDEDIPFRSWGKRYVMYTEGLAMIAERPLTGYGPGTIRNIRKHYESERLYGAGHFHSFPITAGVALGTVWTALWFGLAGMLLWRGTRGFIQVLGDPGFAWGAAGFFGFYLVTSQFQVRMFQSAGSAYLVLAMAIMFGGALLDQWHRRDRARRSH